MPLSAERKTEYFERMKELLGTYTKCFIVEVDNVGSKQLQMTRLGLRGVGEILMGKNTMMRKVRNNVLAACSCVDYVGAIYSWLAAKTVRQP